MVLNQSPFLIQWINQLSSLKLDIPNFINNAEVDTLISNINLVNYYTKTKVDTQSTNYATISYLMTNYATTTLLSDNVYDKKYLDTQFSGLVTHDYLNLNILIVLMYLQIIILKQK